MTYLIRLPICSKCVRAEGIRCNGPCPCPFDPEKRSIHDHAADGDCPKNKFPQHHPAFFYTPEQFLPLIDTPPDPPLPIDFHKWDNARAAYRLAMRAAVDACPAYPADQFAGRGITICAGNGAYFAAAFVTISVLRHLGCSLDIELWGLSSEHLADWQARALDGLHVTYRQSGAMLAESGWPLKSFAILHSRFREILALDADAFPIREPSFLFNEPGYVRYGTIAWPDQPSFDIRPDTWGLTSLGRGMR
jgi:hypothetical protein